VFTARLVTPVAIARPPLSLYLRRGCLTSSVSPPRALDDVFSQEWNGIKGDTHKTFSFNRKTMPAVIGGAIIVPVIIHMVIKTDQEALDLYVGPARNQDKTVRRRRDAVEREKENERQRETETKRDTERHRETQRDRERETDKEREREREREREKKRKRDTERHRETQRGTERHRVTKRDKEKQREKQKDTEIHRET
jgi:hypothetical protein